MSQPHVPVGDLLATQQDTIDELTATVARHERRLEQLQAALAAHGIHLDDSTGDGDEQE